MTLPFRFFRAELSSGVYLYRISTLLNNIVKRTGGILDELVYWVNVQFLLSSEVTGKAGAMRVQDIVGIGVVAGVFPLYFEGGYWTGALFFTEKYIVDGHNYSERGLYGTQTEDFDYVRTTQENYPTDISALASPTERMSVIPRGATPVGYLLIGAQPYNKDGTLNWSEILTHPPAPGVPYEPFYGEDFSTLSMDADVISQLGIDVTKQLIVAMQYVRHNGPSFHALLSITQIICQDAICDISFSAGVHKNVILNYRINPNTQVTVIQQRVRVWAFILVLKWKMYTLNEVGA